MRQTRDQVRRSAELARARKRGVKMARLAFSDRAMIEHSALIVWTRGQMNGVRAAIKRLGLA